MVVPPSICDSTASRKAFLPFCAAFMTGHEGETPPRRRGDEITRRLHCSLGALTAARSRDCADRLGKARSTRIRVWNKRCTYEADVAGSPGCRAYPKTR